MKQMHINRLIKWADYLETVPPKSFDMRVYAMESACGTVACALGHACYIPSFAKEGLRLDLEIGCVYYLNEVEDTEAAMEFFGLSETEAENITLPWNYDSKTNPTAKQVARRIRQLVTKKLAEKNAKKGGKV